jgi:hypothetical protein
VAVVAIIAGQFVLTASAQAATRATHENTQAQGGIFNGVPAGTDPYAFHEEMQDIGS